MDTIKLSKPFEFEGKTYTEIELDLDGLTGRSLIDAEREAAAVMGRPSVDIDKVYQACVAAMAAGMPYDALTALPAKDFTRITGAVQAFLLQD